MPERTTNSTTRVIGLGAQEPIPDAGATLEAELREVMDPPLLLARIHRLEDDVRGLRTCCQNILSRLETIEQFMQESSL